MESSRPQFLFSLLLISACCALVPCKADAQLSGKPYQQWTAKESESLQTNSPWAQTLGGLIGVGKADPPTAAVNTTVTVSLRSALPVRQARARLRQIRAKYDQKSVSEKVAFDEKNKVWLDCPECADQYVVAMSAGPGSLSGVPMFMERMTLAALQMNIQMKNEKGETRDLLRVIRPKFAEDDAIFFFSRLNAKGEPLIGPANRKLIISFDPRIFGWKTPRLTKFEFDVSRMIVNGQVAF